MKGHIYIFSSHSQSIDTPKNSIMLPNEIPISPVPQSNRDVSVKEASIVELPSTSEIEPQVSQQSLPPPATQPLLLQQSTQPLVFLVRSHSDAEIALPDANSSKKLQKLMSFDMMEPGIIQEIEDGIMLEDDIEIEEDDFVFNEFNEDYLEGITSCNKVENCVILSEFEQNLLSENDDASLQERRLRDPNTKKWFHKRAKNYQNNPEALANRGKKWNQVLPGPSKEMATVIEETSTV